jgi:hypothetical protein
LANIQTGSVVSELRGKVGDEVYSRNKSGSYVKGFAVPVQPDTASQLTARARMATAVTEWQALSDSQRMDWIVFANGLNSKNSLGTLFTSAGYNKFVSYKLNLLQTGLTKDPNPLPGIAPPTFEAFFAVLAEGDIKVTVNTPVRREDYVLQFYMSPPVSSAIMSPNSVRYDQIFFWIVESGTTPSVDGPYTIKFGSMVGTAGQKIFMKCRLVQIKSVDDADNTVPFTGRGYSSFFCDSGVIQP